MARLRESPTLTTLVVLVGVYALTEALAIVRPGAVGRWFVLSLPVDVHPWTVVTSVYAHGGPGHLVSNAVALLVVGLIVERHTSAERFHLFFLATGALTGLAEVWFAAAAGPVVPWVQPNVGVLGASGAIFALIGYVLGGNWLSDRLAGRVALSTRAQVVVFLVLAAAVTWYTGNPGAALVAHFTGLLLGLLAGRAHLLRP